MKKEVFIIGSGPGDIKELTQEALELIASCDEIYSFGRIGELFHSLRDNIIKCSIVDIEDRINHSSKAKIGILVSGDVGFFSMAKTLSEKLDGKYSVHLICGVSSLQYFCAKLKIDYENVKVVSLHGRNANLPGSIAYNRYTFVLTGGENNASYVLKDLVKKGLSGIRVAAGEMLSMVQERIIIGTVEELSEMVFSSLTVLLFENENYKSKENALFDREFMRNETPMTKQEVRWVSINMLEINPCDILFDIGAGSGSVAVEMGRKAYDGLVFAIEKEQSAFELLEKNRSALGALNVIPVFGEASEEMQKLPIPDKAFIGGSSGNLNCIIKYLYQINSEIKLVITAITIETLGMAMAVLKEIDFHAEVVCLNSARNKTIGEYNLMMANNPVYIIRGTANEK
ncbi:bifunctional cobalt-precorrin-7 (C(5))-methyltransferase/cobalt-precorrin-6B (C(15))-methyltransferase [Acetivibrio cellulolyticus]|uniref:bifunctional cobalt-precorrin-7 (C(5))-methyltransferase/cobalt-precorrin-6B (C(15))-methyltransferase n=1 Tax=Acetivibrio cellulolyticus TaxID=35830 RepID=UPI0001E2CBFE|nr:bifunctional cobalt-precorrin-7 (C(5))-methyltransferase/cobalt-precorrin-6B (C(15))-methyltransferase [Acetivibrio cellulolyticus]